MDTYLRPSGGQNEVGVQEKPGIDVLDDFMFAHEPRRQIAFLGLLGPYTHKRGRSFHSQTLPAEITVSRGG